MKLQKNVGSGVLWLGGGGALELRCHWPNKVSRASRQEGGPVCLAYWTLGTE
jgi:hypothetical protein